MNSHQRRIHRRLRERRARRALALLVLPPDEWYSSTETPEQRVARLADVLKRRGHEGLCEPAKDAP
jgi:hypothetical protein